MTTATDMVTAYLNAEAALLLGKEYQLGDRHLKSEDLAEIRAGRKEWEARARAEALGRTPTLGGRRFSLANLAGKE